MKYLITSAVAVGFMASALPSPAADTAECTKAKLWQDAFNKGDVASITALYLPDAIEVLPFGIMTGAQAVHDRVANELKQGEKNLTITTTKCDIVGPLRISYGEWKGEVPQGPESGYWSGIEQKDGDTWKTKILTVNLTPPPPPDSAKSAAK